MTGPGSSCGACKFLRRKCTSECVFAPYFCYDLAASHFAAVHKVFGASNVSKLLLHLPVHNRNDAAISIAYEALARMQDPVYGCVAHIFSLQQQVVNLQEEIDSLLNQMPNLATGVDPSGGDFQAAATLSTEKSQLSMQSGIMSSVYHQEEQAALPNNPVVTAAINQTPGNQMNEVYKWQEESFVSDTVANLAGVGFDAADLGIEGFMWAGNEANVGGSWLEGPGWW